MASGSRASPRASCRVTAMRHRSHVGEACLPGSTADLTGRVTLAFVDADLITLVEVSGGKCALSVDAARSDMNHGLVGWASSPEIVLTEEGASMRPRKIQAGTSRRCTAYWQASQASSSAAPSRRSGHTGSGSWESKSSTSSVSCSGEARGRVSGRSVMLMVQGLWRGIFAFGAARDGMRAFPSPGLARLVVLHAGHERVKPSVRQCRRCSRVDGPTARS